MGMSMSKIWTVRGISDDIQKRVSDAAQAAGMRLGPFVERILLDALERLERLERPEGQGAPAGQGDAGDLAERVADLAATVEVVRALFEKHRRQDFPSVVERLERLEAAQAVPAIPSLPSRDGDGGRGREVAAIPGRLAPDNVKPRRTGVGRGVGGGKRLTDEQNRQIADMLKAGRPYSEIAPIVGVSIGGLTKIKQRLADQGLLTEAGQGPGEEELTSAQLLQIADEAERALRPLEEIQRVSEMQKDGTPDVEIAEFLKGGREEPGDQEPDQGS
jgi:hypothetical protein